MAKDCEVDFKEVLAEAGIVLPKQAILENFVHHNPWENLQYMTFDKAYDYVADALSYLSPGEKLLRLCGSDPRGRANAATVGICAVFLDRGVAKWEAPNRYRGFLYHFASLERLGFTKWRAYAREVAGDVLGRLEGIFMQWPPATKEEHDTMLQQQYDLSERILQENLIAFGSNHDTWMRTARSLMLDLPGWAGMFERMQNNPAEAPSQSLVRVVDFLAVQSIFVRSSIQALAQESGLWDPKGSMTLGELLAQAPVQRVAHEEYLQNPSGLAYIDQNADCREDLEVEFEAKTFQVLEKNLARQDNCAPGSPSMQRSGRPKLQVFTCIDERECSFRRYFEEADAFGKGAVETFGVAGFFNLPIRYRCADGRHEEILAPEGSKPGNILHEEYPPGPGTETFVRRRRRIALLWYYWEMGTFCPFRSLLIALMFPITLYRLFMMAFCPTLHRKIKQRFSDMFMPEPTPDIKAAFTAIEAADRLATVFNILGLTDRFAPILLVLGHGSRTVNNPFDAAHNCGACGGREGGPNARVLASYSNNPEVRKVLREKHNINIPEDTWVVGGFHDTSSELVELFDVEDAKVPAHLKEHWETAQKIIYEARGRNAVERCGKFMLATEVHSSDSMEKALSHVNTRSTDLGEARPELGHATNAAVIVGRRELTKGTFLARRAFLPSYDPFNDDDRGSNLEQVIAPALVVCSGINLEYYFSTTDGGAGTKICMNIVGEIGVMQGCNSDLLVGLPTQMTEMHSPMRALYLIDTPLDRLKAVLERREALRNLIQNEWVRIFVREPIAPYRKFRYARGRWVPYSGPITTDDMPDEDEELAPTADNSTESVTVWSAKAFVPFTHHLKYGKAKAAFERMFAWTAALGMITSCIVSMHYYPAETMMNPRGREICIGGTVIALLNLGFARRYLHGEFMFARFLALGVLMLAGFNIVAVAPTLKILFSGWAVLGFATAFLIGAYSERPTARENATFVFFLYQLSDHALLVAVALSVTGQETNGWVASALLLAAFTKASQFPVTNLFARSMESASPSSALADAALSAHAGVILLAGTTSMWYHLSWARGVLAFVGGFTAFAAHMISRVRADRKGSLGNAIAATIGMIYVVLAAGYTDLALVLAFGHAVFRKFQILRSHNLLLEHHIRFRSLGHDLMDKFVAKREVSERLYRVAWMLNRISADLYLPFVGIWFKSYYKSHKMELPASKQYITTFLMCCLGGMPFTPIAYFRELMVVSIVASRWWVLAVFAILVCVIVSTSTLWFTFANVLDIVRFRHTATRPRGSHQVVHTPSGGAALSPSKSKDFDDVSMPQSPIRASSRPILS